jgi:hypothetical protein
MRLIDAERIPNDEFFKGLTDVEKAKVLQWFVSAPTVDAVEVVRCKDCIYSFMTYDGKHAKYCDMFDSDDGVYFDADHYCAYGERRTDNE